MEIQKKCQWCGKPFIAHTMITRYCSIACTGKAYKDKQKKKRLQEYDNKQNSMPMAEVGSVGNKQFLTPNDAAALLGLSRATIYRHMASGLLRALQLRGRTIIRRSDIERLFDEAPTYKKHTYGRKPAMLYYSINEILEKYRIQKKTLYRRCKIYNIPKIVENNRVFYNRALIDKYFSELLEEINPDLYYTPDEVMEKYGMSRAAVVTFALRHNIPRINRHHEVYYSRAHIDAIKEKLTKLNPDYYTYQEIGEKYGISTINISYYVNKYDIERIKQGSKTLVLRTAFDKTYREHRDGTYRRKKRISTKNKDSEPQIPSKPNGYLSAEDIAGMYLLTKRTVWNHCRQNNIPKIYHGGLYYYEQLTVQQFFSRYQAKEDVKEWISAGQMEQQYGMTKDARRSFAHRHNIPTRNVYGRVMYSRDHIERIKTGGFDQRDNYYSVIEAMEKYGLKRDAVYNYAKYNKVRKVHYGNSMYLFKEDFDRIMQEKCRKDY